MEIDKTKREKVEKAIYKKAVGFKSVSVVDEWAVDQNGTLSIVKRKVTTKDTEPDLGAAKMILDSASQVDYDSMTPQQLLEEKQRLIKELLQNENDKEQR